MAKYINSDNIVVYPSARRGVKSSSARLVTEQSLVNIVNKLIDTDGFVITKPETFNLNNAFEFNIYGYYFKVEPASSITSLISSPTDNTTIYGVISLATLSTNATDFEALSAIYELEGQDEDTVYTGIEFVTDPPAPGKHYLALLTYTNGSWTPVPQSLFKFNSESTYGVVDVDGGVI